MSYSIFTRSNPSMGQGPSNFVDFDKEAVHVVSGIYRVDTSKAYPVTVDINGGVPMAVQPVGAAAVSGQVVGTTRTATVGKEVVLNCTASDPGSLVIEDSSDGNTWGSAQTFPMFAGQSIGVRFIPSLVNYRARFLSLPGAYVNKVHVCSQVRDLGQ